MSPPSVSLLPLDIVCLSLFCHKDTRIKKSMHRQSEESIGSRLVWSLLLLILRVISIVGAIGATIWDMHYRTHQMVHRVADHCQRDIVIITSQGD
jgi:hypothetical protein